MLGCVLMLRKAGVQDDVEDDAAAHGKLSEKDHPMSRRREQGTVRQIFK